MIVLCSTDDKVQERWYAYLEGLGDVYTCSTYDQLIEIKADYPDAIVLLQIGFPQMDNTAAIAAFIENNSLLKTIACADTPDDDQGLELLKAGVSGYCNTWMAAAQMERVIEQVKAGEVWVGRSLLLRLIRDLAPASPAEPATPQRLMGLTEREDEVARLIGQGNSNKQIANTLDITERTVKAHISAIFRKTGCKDRVQLALQVNQPNPRPYSKLGT